MSAVNGSVIERKETTSASHDARAEAALLGALMQAKGEYADTPARVFGLLAGAGAFYEPRNQMLFRKICALSERGEVPDPQAVLGSLNATEQRMTNNGTYLATCVGLASAPQAMHYAGIVREYSDLREAREFLARQQATLGQVSLNESVAAIHRLRDEAQGLRLGGVSTALVSNDDVNGEVISWMREQGVQGETPSGPTTGWPDIDQYFHCFAAGQLVIIAGRPGMGKSTAARNIAQHIAMRQKMPALFFTLEMSRVEVGLSMISSGSKVPLETLRTGCLSLEEWTRVGQYTEDTAGAPLYYDETPGMNLAHIEAGIRQKKLDHGHVGAVFIDYIGLVSPDDKRSTRQETVSALSRGFKMLGKRYDTTIFMVCQLNRGPEGRTDKRPQLSDLRESGSLEQDADIVILLHRPEYYEPESPQAGEAEFIIAKHRNGRTGTETLAAQLHLSKFVSMAE